MDANSFVPLISGILGGAVSAGVFKGPIQMLDDLWFIKFGYSTSEKVQKIRANQQHNIENYKKTIATEVSKIDVSNIQEPKLNILGPSLEASQYYIDDEEIRNMFAKLIASSMDNSKKNIVHSSYVEIIKQLSPVDAHLLSHLFTNSGTGAIASVIEHYSTGGYSTLHHNLYIVDNKIQDQSLISASLSNLSRLGLIDLSYTEWKNNDDLYKPFKKLNEYKDAKESKNSFTTLANKLDKNLLASTNELNKFSLQKLTPLQTKRLYQLKENINYLKELKKKIPSITNVDLKKGKIELTPFGSNFCNICI